MGGAFSYKKKTNAEVPKTCILIIWHQQEPPKAVAKRPKINVWKYKKEP